MSQQRIALIRPPFFTPMSPPLGIGLLKAFLEARGHAVRCFDFNVDPDLWGAHHRYFTTLLAGGQAAGSDGYSRLWYLLNAHTLAHAQGATAEACARVVRAIAPLYDLQVGAAQLATLQDIVTGFFARLSGLLDAIELSAFDYIGTSSYSTSLPASLFALRRIKRRHPAARTLIGGGVFFDDMALGSSNLEVLLAEHDYVDHAIVGEGELALLQLVEGACADKRLITGADLGGAALPIEAIPAPDFSYLDMDAYTHLTIEGGRSCPFQCSFCSETVQWGSYRKKPRDQLSDQMEALAGRHGNRRFFMGDSLVNPYIDGLAGELLRRGAGLLYDGYLRADRHVTADGRAAEWARSGFYRARLGLESASPHVLDLMDKRTSPDMMAQVLRALAEAGVRTTTYWITGYPGETERDFQATLDFIRAAHPDIYELEAHPYYYYPYGQVASRAFDAVSVHPEDIDEILRFRVWDVTPAAPSRAERLDRLRRLTELATQLGIPNIYSMVQYYQAEDRWQRLAPAARALA